MFFFFLLMTSIFIQMASKCFLKKITKSRLSSKLWDQRRQSGSDGRRRMQDTACGQEITGGSGGEGLCFQKQNQGN